MGLMHQSLQRFPFGIDPITRPCWRWSDSFIWAIYFVVIPEMISCYTNHRVGFDRAATCRAGVGLHR